MLFRFLAVGGFIALADVLMFSLFLKVMPTRVAFSVSYVLAVLGHFLLNKYWTFRKSQPATFSEVVRYIASVILAFFLQWGGVELFSKFFSQRIGLDSSTAAVLAKALAIPPSTLVMFFLLKLGVFGAAKTSR